MGLEGRVLVKCLLRKKLKCVIGFDESEGRGRGKEESRGCAQL